MHFDLKWTPPVELTLQTIEFTPNVTPTTFMDDSLPPLKPVIAYIAAKAGTPISNSPFSNSRSVAELVISEVIALSRQYFQRAWEMRDGIWNKRSKGCWEVRGKTLGIVGYGHIGSQLSILATSFFRFHTHRLRPTTKL